MAGVSITDSDNIADADGVATVFNFTFFVYEADHIKVYSVLNDVLTPITTGITKAINSSFVGGTVTFSSAPLDAVGEILIRREVPYTQETELANLTRYKETAIEAALNSIVLQVQQLKRESELSLKYTAAAGVTDTTIETPVDGAAAVFDGTTGRLKAGASADDIENAADNAAIAAAAASSASASAATIGGFDLSGAQAANDVIMWDTGSSKFLRKTIGFLANALGITPASASTQTLFDFYEQTTNGTNRARLKSSSALSGNIDIELPSTSGTLALAGATGVATVKRQVFPSNGTYTPSTGMLYCELWAIGGGGGGGGVSAVSGAIAGGGAAGSECKKIVTAATIGASQAITVGAAGSAGANTGGTGGTGGTSSVGAIISALGGLGGVGSTGESSVGGAGQTATGGDFNGTGAAGGAGSGNNVTTTMASGVGGSTSLGGGGVSRKTTAAGAAGATNTGGGGGGASAGAGTAQVGGVGGTGIVIITEWCSQ